MRGPSWQSVQAEALRRIRAREWPPGMLIPAEADLAQELGCARATVNRALRDLAEAGLLERRRKAGTRVAEMPVRRATFDIPVIRRDVEARGLAYGYRLLTRQTAVPPSAILTTLKLQPDARYLHLTALHLAAGAAFCLEDRWINPAIEGLQSADFTQISANEWLVANVAFSGGDVAFGAVVADAPLAAALGCAPGAALLTLDRTTWSGAVPVTAVRLSYAPGHRVATVI